MDQRARTISRILRAVSILTISFSSPTSPADDKQSGVDGSVPEFDLGIGKMKSPSHSPGMVKDVGLGKVAGVLGQMRPLNTKELPEAEQRVPGQIFK